MAPKWGFVTSEAFQRVNLLLMCTLWTVFPMIQPIQLEKIIQICPWLQLKWSLIPPWPRKAFRSSLIYWPWMIKLPKTESVKPLILCLWYLRPGRKVSAETKGESRMDMQDRIWWPLEFVQLICPGSWGVWHGQPCRSASQCCPSGVVDSCLNEMLHETDWMDLVSASGRQTHQSGQ